MTQMKKWKLSRRTNNQVIAATSMTRSRLKTQLKCAGFVVDRNFWGFGCMIARRNSRLYRVRFDQDTCFVDQSCVKADFDRWANSTDKTFEFKEFAAKFL